MPFNYPEYSFVFKYTLSTVLSREHTQFYGTHFYPMMLYSCMYKQLWLVCLSFIYNYYLLTVTTLALQLSVPFPSVHLIYSFLIIYGKILQHYYHLLTSCV